MEHEVEWSDLTPQQKLEKRYDGWLSADIDFSGPDARRNYKEREQ